MARAALSAAFLLRNPRPIYPGTPARGAQLDQAATQKRHLEANPKTFRAFWGTRIHSSLDVHGSRVAVLRVLNHENQSNDGCRDQKS
jgi:hypothetical protein